MGKSGKPDSDRARKIAEMRAAQKRSERKRKFVFGGLVVVVVGVMGAGIGIGVANKGGGDKNKPNPAASAAPSGTGPEGIPLEAGTVLAGLEKAASGATVNGVSCDASEQVAYHIHTHLAIYVNGTLRPVPTGIGIVTPQITQGPGGPFAAASKCYYWLHTHTNDGIVHIESPTPKTYTLGDFFAIWGQTLNANAVGSQTGAVTAYVNGTKFTGDPATIPLGSRTAIQLDVGSDYPFQTVDWSKSQL
jgi:hypothetical protein